MNIKVGDKVVQLGSFGAIVKTVNEINPKTISVCQYYNDEIEIATEPKQNPANWRICEPAKVKRMLDLAKQVDELHKECYGLYKSLPEIEI